MKFLFLLWQYILDADHKVTRLMLLAFSHNICFLHRYCLETWYCSLVLYSLIYLGNIRSRKPANFWYWRSVNGSGLEYQTQNMDRYGPYFIFFF
ncbi:hypothetical protein GDO81_003510 [Engystomops pustulosus]|uniref:Uncharacterized protein n=1 Tax=Engystomops pustulosus TaxID=76066 RepID=A0AAV6ZWI6_ENGPU|nr:hypothetical protein GDO81_003510 [Engystomops pustulosus]